MLSFIQEIDNPFTKYIKDDPVRPDLSVEFRISKNKFISVLHDDDVKAIVCVSLHDFIPQDVEELEKVTDKISSAIFYTIWSYSSGSASDLLFQTVDRIKEVYPNVTRFVTLSPKTEMARKFHLKNGAIILRENETTVNYEYLMTQ
jgi:hypothetical protein